MIKTFLLKNKKILLVGFFLLAGLLLTWILIDPRFKKNQEIDENLKNETEINYQIIIEESESFPVDNLSKYQFIENPTQYQNQYIVELDSSLPVVFFPEKISNPNLISSNNLVFLQDLNDLEEFFIIDPQTGQKNKYKNQSIKNIEDLIFSLDGKYFVFTSSNDPRYRIYDFQNNQIINTNINSNFSKVAWLENNSLLFITSQNSDDVGDNSIEIFDSPNAENIITFGYYDFEKNLYQKLISPNSLQIFGQLEDLIPLNNRQEVYVKISGSNFKIILERL